MKTVNGYRDTSGGIEGLPLQLMIIIIVATMGTAILVGWMGSIDSPQSVGSVIVNDGSGAISANGNELGDFEITVYDQDGNPLEGASVVLSGLGVKMDGGTAYTVTDANGVASFTKMTINTGLDGVGTIGILVTKTGYTESSSNEILVIL